MSRIVRYGMSVVLVALLAVAAAAAPYDFGGETVRVSGLSQMRQFLASILRCPGMGHVQEVEDVQRQDRMGEG